MASSPINATDVVAIIGALTRIPVVGDFLRTLLEAFVNGAGPDTNPEAKTIADDVLRNIGPNVTRDWLDKREGGG